jgi:hypothetical protein
MSPKGSTNVGIRIILTLILKYDNAADDTLNVRATY